MRRILILAWSVLFVAGPTFAQEKPTLIIRGGKIFDARSAETRPLGQLWIQGEKILGERAADAVVPDGTRVIEASDFTLLPGLFDLHVHIAVPGSFGPMPEMPSAEENLASHLYCGVTHVVDLHGDENTIFQVRDASRKSTSMARLYVAGAAFTSPKGHGTQFGIPCNTVTSPKEVESRFAELLPKKPDVIKVIIEHGKWGGLPERPTLSSELVTAVTEQGKAAGLPVFCHIFNDAEALTATRSGVNTLAHGVFLDAVTPDLVEAMKSAGTAYVPTLTVVHATRVTIRSKSPYHHDLVRNALHPDLYDAITSKEIVPMLNFLPMARAFQEESPAYLKNLKTLADAGVRVGLGTDAGNPLVPHGPGVIFELECYVESGLTPGQALRAATLSSAQILGIETRFGSLEEGKVADAVLVYGDPTQDISAMWNVKEVVKAGHVVDRDAVAKRNLERRRPAVVVVAGKEVPQELDAFQDGNLESLWGGTWKPSVDRVAPGGKSSIELSVLKESESPTLRIAGSVNEGFQWGAWAGVMILWDPGRKRWVDASGFEGIVLRIRGSDRPYFLTLQRAAVKDYNTFTTQLKLKEEWQEVKIPFASMKQIGFGTPVPWSAADLTGLNIEARNVPMTQPVFGEFHIEIDWVKLY